MSGRPRYYLTTAIAYANNNPLHTLYDDRRGRHRALAPMKGDDAF
jgi:hypothetical protein